MTTHDSGKRYEPGNESSNSNHVTQFQDSTLDRTNHTDHEGEKEPKKDKISLFDEQVTSYYSILAARYKFQIIATITAAAFDGLFIVLIWFHYRVNQFHHRFVSQHQKFSLNDLHKLQNHIYSKTYYAQIFRQQHYRENDKMTK